MIKIENIQTYGWEGAFRGMRAPLQSWAKSDSYFYPDGTFSLGEADLDLAKRLVKAGTEHRKFLRFIHVQILSHPLNLLQNKIPTKLLPPVTHAVSCTRELLKNLNLRILALKKCAIKTQNIRHGGTAL